MKFYCELLSNEIHINRNFNLCLKEPYCMVIIKNSNLTLNFSKVFSLVKLIIQ